MSYYVPNRTQVVARNFQHCRYALMKYLVAEHGLTLKEAAKHVPCVIDGGYTYLTLPIIHSDARRNCKDGRDEHGFWGDQTFPQAQEVAEKLRSMGLIVELRETMNGKNQWQVSEEAAQQEDQENWNKMVDAVTIAAKTEGPEAVSQIIKQYMHENPCVVMG